MNINQSQRCSSKPIKWKQLVADFNEFADYSGFLSWPYSHGGHIVPRDWKKLCFTTLDSQWKTWERGWTGKTKLLQPLGTKWPPCEKDPYPGFRGPFSKWDEINRKNNLLELRVTILWLAKAKMWRNFSCQTEIIMTSSHTISTIDKYSERSLSGVATTYRYTT